MQEDLDSGVVVMHYARPLWSVKKNLAYIPLIKSNIRRMQCNTYRILMCFEKRGCGLMKVKQNPWLQSVKVCLEKKKE